MATALCPICGKPALDLAGHRRNPLVLRCSGSHREYTIDTDNNVLERLNDLDRGSRETVYTKAARYAFHRGDARPRIDVTCF